MNNADIEKIYQITLDCVYGRVSQNQVVEYYQKYLEVDIELRKQCGSVLIERFEDILQACRGQNFYYFVLSYMIEATRSSELCRRFIVDVIEDSVLNIKEKYYLWNYIGRLFFVGTLVRDSRTLDLLDNLYQSILNWHREACKCNFTFVPFEERNKDLVIVLTTQVLNLKHGPTKTLMDRCYVLMKYMNKKIFIINTAEGAMDIPGGLTYYTVTWNYIDQYSSIEYLEYNDCQFAYYQCPRGMPDVAVISEILDVVAAEKPLCIVSIGGGSIVNDLCSKIVPTITVSLVPSQMEQSYGQFQAVGYHVGEEDYQWAAKHGRMKDYFIESIFTSTFKPQEHTYTRNELCIPEEGFIVVLVGGRLDFEVDEGCLKLILKLMNQGIYVAFMGTFHRYGELCQSEPLFQKYAINLGFQDDVLAVLECCNLYLNPRRVGGGTSVAEALYKGIPVVTMNYGDGGLGAGEDFWVTDYEEMYDTVLKYARDASFYERKREQAKERAEILMDSAGQFVKIMETAMNREGFQ